jgi:hypothetical protein
VSRPASGNAAGAAVLAAVALAAALLLGCAGTANQQAAEPHQPPRPPAADSVTVALWAFDENGGPTCADSGPFRLRGTAGPETRTDFGRYKSARLFARTQQSFVFVPANAALDAQRGFTVEAWVHVASFSPYELECIAGRWSPIPGEQSWMFGITGRNESVPLAPVNSPGLFTRAVSDQPAGRLVFIIQPAEAAAVTSFASVGAVPLDRWVHVAATLDGSMVQLYLDGRLDSQFASLETIRPSVAPLVIGSYLDERRLSELTGQLLIDSPADYSRFYGFDGFIDEVRLSRTARSRFESIDTR